MQTKARSIEGVELWVEHFDNCVLTLTKTWFFFECAPHRLDSDLTFDDFLVGENVSVYILPAKDNDLTSVFVSTESADGLLFTEIRVFHLEGLPDFAHHHKPIVGAVYVLRWKFFLRTCIQELNHQRCASHCSQIGSWHKIDVSLRQHNSWTIVTRCCKALAIEPAVS